MLNRLLSLEPALVRSVAAFIVLVASNIGLNITDEANQAVTVVLAGLALVPLLQGWWTRQAVTPNAKVVEHIETAPAGLPDIVVAGEANELVETGVAIRVRDAH